MEKEKLGHRRKKVAISLISRVYSGGKVTYLASLHIDQQLLERGICEVWSIGKVFEVP
jgi:hypothetical protein